MKQRDPSWREIRKHHVIPDKRDDEVLRQHQQEIAHGVELQAGSRCMDMCSVHHVPASSMTAVRESMGASFKGIQWLAV